MNLHKVDESKFHDDNIDHLIRWALHDSVAGAEPSAQVWERIQQGIADCETATASAPVWYRALWQRLTARWLAEVGVHVPAQGDVQPSGQGRMYAFDMRAPMSMVRIIEGKMPVVRLVS